VRETILANLPKRYVETVKSDAIAYVIPFEIYPKTYNGQLLLLATLASKKNYMTIHLMNVYGDKETASWFQARYKASGKKGRSVSGTLLALLFRFAQYLQFFGGKVAASA